MGDAKLLRPPVLPGTENPPPTPAKPLPRDPNPEPPEADAKADVVVPEVLKTEGVDAPRAPKGDFSEPAKAAREEDAKAEVEAVWSIVVESSDVLEVRSEAKGEEAEVFANALAAKLWEQSHEKMNDNQRENQNKSTHLLGFSTALL